MAQTTLLDEYLQPVEVASKAQAPLSRFFTKFQSGKYGFVQSVLLLSVLLGLMFLLVLTAVIYF